LTTGKQREKPDNDVVGSAGSTVCPRQTFPKKRALTGTERHLLLLALLVRLKEVGAFLAVELVALQTCAAAVSAWEW